VGRSKSIILYVDRKEEERFRVAEESKAPALASRERSEKSPPSKPENAGKATGEGMKQLLRGVQIRIAETVLRPGRAECRGQSAARRCTRVIAGHRKKVGLFLQLPNHQKCKGGEKEIVNASKDGGQVHWGKTEVRRDERRKKGTQRGIQQVVLNKRIISFQNGTRTQKRSEKEA